MSRLLFGWIIIAFLLISMMACDDINRVADTINASLKR